jgi:hypothetical protein
MMRRWSWVLLVAMFVAGSVGGAWASRIRAGDPNLSVAGVVNQVKTTYGELAIGTSGTAWTEVARIPVSVPAGQQALVVARFDGETSCDTLTPGSGDGACELRIKALQGTHHVPLRPSSMTTALEVVGGEGEDAYSLSMEKSRVLPAGTWTIVVQHRVTDPGVYFAIYAHHLTVEWALA